MKIPPLRLGLLLLGSLLLGALAAHWHDTPEAVPPDPRPVAAISYATAVERASPAVFNIYSRKVITEKTRRRFRDPWLQRLYGDRLPEQTRRRLETSLGSGVVVSPQGYALTNRHVISGAEEILAALANGDRVAVEVVGEAGS